MDELYDAADAETPGLRERVKAAAFAMLREGKMPTVRGVRSRMGGGNFNAVAAALQQWRSQLSGTLNDNEATALEVLPPSILDIVQALWARALFEAQGVKADSKKDRESRTHLAELRAIADRLREREVRLDAQLADIEERQERLRAAERAVHEREAALERQLADLSLRQRRANEERAAARPIAAPRASAARGHAPTAPRPRKPSVKKSKPAARQTAARRHTKKRTRP